MSEPVPAAQQSAMKADKMEPIVIHVATPFPSRMVIVGRTRQLMICPYCGAETTTVTICTPSLAAWVAFIVLLFVFFPVCFIPLLVCQDIEHRCARCGGIVGRFIDPTCR